MTSPAQTPSRLLVSISLHAVVLAAILYRHPPEVAPMRLPGTPNGSRLELTYSPGRAPLQASLPDRKSPLKPAVAAPPRPTFKATAATLPAPTSPNATSQATAEPNAVTGADALGDGNVSIALASHFPAPRPDLSGLARGTSGDVVLDIVIDSTGIIADIRVARGLGHGIDEAVIATVQQWTFQPATRDGKPISSEQELLFHYERT